MFFQNFISTLKSAPPECPEKKSARRGLLHSHLRRLFSFGSAAMLLLTIICTTLSGCSMNTSSTAAYTERTGFYFDTVINVRLYAPQDETILDGCMAVADKYDKLLSAQTSGSDIWNINHADGAPVKVSADTISVLKSALYYADLSDGAFNPALGSVISLWNFTSNEDGILPDDSAITAALEHTSYKAVIIDEDAGTVSLTDPDVQIDLGAIAKGFIADQIKTYLLNQNVTSAIINLGGNVLLVGSKPDGTDFSVGVEKPFGGSGSYITSVSASDQSVVTSGVYERYFTVDGKIYHHILDPNTGYPTDNSLYSVTILSDNSTDGDALSTTCFVLGLTDGMKLIESLDGVEALFITNDDELHYSSGFPK